MTRSLRERLQRLQQSVQQKRSDLDVSNNLSNDVSNEYACESQSSSDQHGLVELGFRLIDHPVGKYWVRELRYDLLTRHGKYRFGDLTYIDKSRLERLIGCDFSLDQLRFYDTETTGLGSGAGTFAFLHTIGRFEEDEYCLYQYFVDEYGAEEAILHVLEETHFSNCRPILVTFNGKSFDWPLLQTRRVMYRLGKLEVAAHFDLLHPARRLWRTDLESVSLVMVEQYILELVRQDDLPGKEAPKRYFEYTDAHDAKLMVPVFEHNAMDVCSLVSMLCMIADLLNGHQQPTSAAQYAALARWHDEWSEYDVANKCYIAATDRVDADWRVFWLQSLFLKRKGKWTEACLVWTKMMERFTWSIQPLIELAKYAEHRQKRFDEAERFVKLAIERRIAAISSADVYIPHRVGGKQGSSQWQAKLDGDLVLFELEHRLTRVRSKMAQHVRDLKS